MPWTAPAYDQREVTADPERYCMSSLTGRDAAGRMQEASCSCFTEQGTRYELDQPQCRTVARHGAPYHPYGRTGRVASNSNNDRSHSSQWPGNTPTLAAWSARRYEHMAHSQSRHRPRAAVSPVPLVRCLALRSQEQGVM